MNVKRTSNRYAFWCVLGVIFFILFLFIPTSLKLREARVDWSFISFFIFLFCLYCEKNYSYQLRVAKASGTPIDDLKNFPEETPYQVDQILEKEIRLVEAKEKQEVKFLAKFAILKFTCDHLKIGDVVENQKNKKGKFYLINLSKKSDPPGRV